MHVQSSYPGWHDYFIPGIVLIVFGIVVGATFPDTTTGARKNANTPNAAGQNSTETCARAGNSMQPGAANDDCETVAAAEHVRPETNLRETHPNVSVQSAAHNSHRPKTNGRYLKTNAGRPPAGQAPSTHSPDLNYEATRSSGYYAQTLKQQRSHWQMMHAYRANKLWRLEHQWWNRIQHRHPIELQRWRRLDNPARAELANAGFSHPYYRHTIIASSK